MSNARADRYRRLARAEQDKAKADLLHKLADECDRGLLCTAGTRAGPISIPTLKYPFSEIDLRPVAVGQALATPEAGAGSMTEARNYRGFDPDGMAETEADHFMKCPGCGEWFDMRDLDQLLAHVHDAEIEICEGPTPPKRERPLH